ncbi:MAG: hypothetical protein KIT84_31910 [Labilithrix sp.]|nr:hypothetical protein [Labilithrix sp.]MCW5815677.1 hypothetical protein [Labilithrix sp.]
MSTHEPHDPDHVATRPIARIALGSALVFFASLGVAWALLPRATAETPRPAPATIGSLETTPILDGDRGRQIASAQRAELDRWRWIDRDAGLAEMPIERAIDRLLDGGGTEP